MGTEKVTFAVAAVLERGTYPMFLARETTFSRTVAASKNDSFTTRLALNALMYVFSIKCQSRQKN